MSEVYPTDDELLALMDESETGVEYIPTGTAPYIVEFRKMLYRLLLSSKRANDFRVYDAGDNYVGVKPGKFWNNGVLYDSPGESAIAIADDTTKYIYVSPVLATGLIETDIILPDMVENPHVRLASVHATNGRIDNITDLRDQHFITVPPSPKVERTIVAHTVSGDTLTDADSGSIHTNKGATGTVVINLPTTNQAGTEFTFVVQENRNLQIDPISLNLRVWSGGGTPGHVIYDDTIGTYVTLVCDGNGNWVPTTFHGGWASGIS
jgi:hypothetical protein